MPLPLDFYDEDTEYSMRVCLTVIEAPLIGVITNSKIHQCDNCGDPIWVAEEQVIPDHPEGKEYTGHVVVCGACAKVIINEDPDPKWLGPKPADWP